MMNIHVLKSNLKNATGLSLVLAIALPLSAMPPLGSSVSAGTTERISVDSSGNQWYNGYESSISADGRFVAFDWNRKMFVRDRLAGSTEQVDISSNGTPGYGLSYYVSISADARFVAFTSWANNLVPNDTNGIVDC
jgi:hypothetical protein